MVSVEFFRDNRGFQMMQLRGHADYNPGQDIVCAGISALAFALVATLDDIHEISFKQRKITDGVTVEIEPFIEFHDQLAVNMAFITVLTGLKLIQSQYPDHIAVSYRQL